MIIVFSLFLFVGSLAAWRASPLYSLKSTFKLAGVTLSLVAVIWGATWLIVSGPLKNSVAGELIVGIPAFLLITTGSMILIVRITDSHVAALPASVQLVTLHRHNILRWGGRLVVYLLICGGTALAVPESWQWLAEMLALFPLIICGPMLGVLYMMARRNDRGMTSVMANPWAHWQYTPEQWQDWIQNELAWESNKQIALSWKAILLSLLTCAALFSVGVLLNGGFTQENIWIFVGLNGLMVLMLLIIVIVARVGPGRRRRKLQAAPHDAWFGDEGVYCNGEYIPWTLSGRYLLSAGTEPGPPQTVVLEFESFSGNTSVKLYKRIPIPPDHGSDLAVIQKKLDATCATALVRLILP
jgi:hypothetical protein